jgi:6-phosphogluconolactonase
MSLEQQVPLVLLVSIQLPEKLDEINKQNSKELIHVISSMTIKCHCCKLLWGNISVFEKKKDGSLAEAKQVVQYGKSNTQRQESPHVHMVHFLLIKVCFRY